MTQKKKKLHRKAISWRRTGKNRRVKHKKPVRIVNQQLKLTWDDHSTMHGNYCALGLSSEEKGHQVISADHVPVIKGADDFGDMDDEAPATEPTGARGEALPAL